MKHSYYVSPSIDCYYMQKTEGKCLTFRERRSIRPLFLLEGHAVSALVYRWVAFMCSHSDAVQAAVVCCIGMMLTAFYHTLDAFVHIHDTTSCSFVTTYDV